MPQSQTYKDFNISFKSHPITNDLLVVKDDVAIKQSIRSLLLTQYGERLFNPEVGTKLKKILFDPLDYATAADVRNEIFRCLSLYEPRISVTSIEVEPNEDKNSYDVELEFEYVSRDSSPVVIEFLLERTRG